MAKENSDPEQLLNNWNDQLGQLYREAEETLFPIYNSLQEEESRYAIASFIGKGGEKVVERVYDKQTGRFVAMAKPIKNDMENYEHFLREARLLTELQHPNIIPVYDLGLVEGEPFFTMEYIQEGSLKELLQGHRKIKLDIFLQVCDAIGFAHSKGVLNLDIKPENIHIGSFSKVLVLDWGLAQAFREKMEGEPYRVKGTPGFIAPEQLNPHHSLGRYTDIYQLGALLYTMVYKKVPIGGDNVKQVFEKTLSGDVDKVDRTVVDPRLNVIIEKAMARSPKDRYKTVLELKKDVQLYMDGYATKAEDAGFFVQLQLLYSRNKIIVNLILFFLMIIGISNYLFIAQVQESEAQAQVDRKKIESILTLNDNFKKHQNEMELAVSNSIESILASEKDPHKLKKILSFPIYNLFNSRNYEGAISYSQGVLKYRPYFEDAHLSLSYLYFIRLEFTKSLEALNKIEDLEVSQAYRELLISYEKVGDHLDLDELLELLGKEVHDSAWDWLRFHTLCHHYYSHSIDEHLSLIEGLLTQQNPQAYLKLEYYVEDNGAVVSLEGSTGLRTLTVFNAEMTVFDSLNLQELHIHGLPRINGVDVLENKGVFITQ